MSDQTTTILPALEDMSPESLALLFKLQGGGLNRKTAEMMGIAVEHLDRLYELGLLVHGDETHPYHPDNAYVSALGGTFIDGLTDPDLARYLFDAALAAKAALSEAEQARADFETASPKPRRPDQVQDFAEWMAYLQAEKMHNSHVEALAQALSAAQKHYSVVAGLLDRFLPTQVWFRHGDYGIGFAYHTWGGMHFELTIEPWREQMPSLDRAYREG